ncbi:hypothetical protein EAF04_000642 [Stromatinia cepivora]|nr:hypothetical protein EAF04_000642 [Stromatinia cepivora]
MNGVWSYLFKELTGLHDAFIANITKDEELSNIEEWVQKRNSIARNLQLVGETMKMCLLSYERAKQELLDIFVREELRIRQSNATQFTTDRLPPSCLSTLKESYTVKHLRTQAIKGLELIDTRNIGEACGLKPCLKHLLSKCCELLATRQEISTSIDDTRRDSVYHGLIKIMIHSDFLHFRTTLNWRGYRNNWNLCYFLEDKAVRDVYYDNLRVLLEERSDLFMSYKYGSEKHLYLIMKEIMDLEVSEECGMVKLDGHSKCSADEDSEHSTDGE